MGGVATKEESPDKYYTNLAVQFKDRLDNLEIFAEALVDNTQSQANTLQFLLEEEERKSATTDTPIHEDLPANDYQHNTDRFVQGETAGLTRLYAPTQDICEDHFSSQESEHYPSTRSSPGNNKRPKSSNSVREYEQRNAYEQYTGPKQNTRSSRSRSGRQFVHEHHSESHSQPMETDFPTDSVSGRASQMSAESQTHEGEKNRYTSLLQALRTNQNSVSASSRGILRAVNNLQSLIPAEITSQHKVRARPDNASYQIRLYEGTPARNPVTSMLYQASETQTDLNGNDLERMTEEFELAKSTTESLQRENKNLNQEIERMTRRHKNDIESYKREVEIARRHAGELRRHSQQGHWYGSSWSKPAPPPRGKATVQIYCHRRSDKINEVNVELETLLKTQFDTINTDLTCMTCETRSQLIAATPTIVLCINASRLGTDVSTSLEGLNRNEKIVVIILHHKDTHALPRQPSSRLLTGPEYKSLGGLIDMAFLSSKGIYACDMNQNALSELMNFINAGQTH